MINESQEADAEINERVEHMARAIYAAYGSLVDYPRDWDATDGTIDVSTKAKYRAIADDVLDKIEWTRFVLVPTPTPEDHDDHQ